MTRAPRRLQSTGTPLQPTDRRGIASLDVDRAADALLREGERPTIERVRARLGRGSPNTINPLLDAWWQRLAGRLDAGPAALHRLPEPVLLAAEGLWLQALDDARRRAAAEQGSRKSSLAKDRQDLEVRAHVLSIRENEISDRLQQSERRVAKLEIELESLVMLLRKEQASRASAERRLLEFRDAVTGRSGRHPPPTAAAPARKRKSLHRARASSRSKRTLPRKVTLQTRSRPR